MNLELPYLDVLINHLAWPQVRGHRLHFVCIGAKGDWKYIREARNTYLKYIFMTCALGLPSSVWIQLQPQVPPMFCWGLVHVSAKQKHGCSCAGLACDGSVSCVAWNHRAWSLGISFQKSRGSLSWNSWSAWCITPCSRHHAYFPSRLRSRLMCWLYCDVGEVQTLSEWWQFWQKTGSRVWSLHGVVPPWTQNYIMRLLFQTWFWYGIAPQLFISFHITYVLLF